MYIYKNLLTILEKDKKELVEQNNYLRILRQ